MSKQLLRMFLIFKRQLRCACANALGTCFVFCLLYSLQLMTSMPWSGDIYQRASELGHEDPPSEILLRRLYRASEEEMMKKTSSETKSDPNRIIILPDDGPGGCNVRNFTELLEYSADLNRLKTCRRIIYNRIPQCDQIPMAVFNSLAKQRHFQLRDKWTYYGVQQPINAKTLKSFARNFSEFREPFLFAQHMKTFDFAKFNLPTPVYISVVRDPMDRLVAYYESKDLGLRKNMSFDDCVEDGKEFCIDKILLADFCGYNKSCATDALALRTAKQMTLNHYAVVGLHEDLPAFMEVLQVLMPHYFKDALKTFETVEQRFSGKMTAGYELRTETVAILKQRLQFEYDFYNFIRQRFYDLKFKMQTLEARAEGRNADSKVWQFTRR